MASRVVGLIEQLSWPCTCLNHIKKIRWSLCQQEKLDLLQGVVGLGEANFGLQR